MQMYSRNALSWVISAILLFPLSYNRALQVFYISELRGVMIGMRPRFPVHYLALLQSQKPQVLMAIFFTPCPCQLLTRCSDGLGPTVHAHAQSICLCLFGCRWKALVKPDVPIKISFCYRVRGRERQRVMEGRGICYINEAMTKRWVLYEWQNNGVTAMSKHSGAESMH